MKPSERITHLYLQICEQNPGDTDQAEKMFAAILQFLDEAVAANEGGTTE